MLPPAWRLTLDPATARRAGGRVLFGGTPFRIWRLNERAAAVVDRLAAGEPIGEDDASQSLARRLIDAGMANPKPADSSRSPADVTIVVPFFGAATELATTLAALASLGAAGDGEQPGAIVVDDGSSDRGAGAVAARYGARLERHATNRGPAAARNTGWRAASTEVVAFLDAGCIPDARWLATLVPHLDDPEVAAVAPRIQSITAPSLPRALAAYEAARPSLDRGELAGAVRPRSPVPFVPSTALVVRVADLQAAGGFDEDLRFGEDVDLVWRLVDAGRTVRYEPAAHVGHLSRGATRSWLRQRFDYGTSAAPLARRHDDKVRPLATSPRVVAAWALAGLGPVPMGPALGVAVAGWTTAALVPKLAQLPEPKVEAVRLSGRAHRYVGLALADAIRRPWWPLALAAAVVSRRARRVVLVAVVVPPAVEWVRDRPGIDPLRWTALRLLDDVAYGAGVWAGCVRTRSLRALLPAGRG